MLKRAQVKGLQTLSCDAQALPLDDEELRRCSADLDALPRQ
jgi:hypothetical protein